MTTNKIHLAIIPDGNRRWAKAKTWLPWKGHEVAIENFRTITDWCRSRPDIGILTVWCFSTENWKRDQEEVSKLMQMLEEYLRKEREDFAAKQTRLVHSGRKDRMPASLAQLIAEVEEETKNHTGFTLHLAVDYGGKDEVVRAMEKWRSANGEVRNPVTEDVIADLLDHPELPQIDLIIRTSGEQRTSNFFLWQSAYAEWIFLQKHFPEVNTEDLANAIEEFSRRKRRFGA